MGSHNELVNDDVIKTISQVREAGKEEEQEGECLPIATNGNIIDDGLQRGLKSRHLQMISLGGVVGASIWYGTGTAIASSGPVGALICFAIIGIDVYFVMQSLGILPSNSVL